VNKRFQKAKIVSKNLIGRCFCDIITFVGLFFPAIFSRYKRKSFYGSNANQKEEKEKRAVDEKASRRHNPYSQGCYVADR
jgi:hypothetical protein